MKNLLYCLILISLSLSVYVGFDQVGPAANLDNGVPLSKFIIGKWDSQEQVTDPKGNYSVKYEIEFIDENKFHYLWITPDNDYEDDFTYQFIGDNVIKVHGRRDATIREWELKRISQKLEICFAENSCTTYTRIKEKIEWWWIFVTLAAVVLAFYLLKKFTVKNSQSSI